MSKAVLGGVIALAIVALGLSFYSMSNTPETIADPQVSANQETIKLLTSKVSELIEANNSLTERLGTYILDHQEVHTVIDESLSTKMNTTHVANLQARLLQVESGLATVGEHKIVVPVPKAEPKKTFSLVTFNAQNLPQDVFGINQVVYITGDSSGTTEPEAILKIIDPNGIEILKKEIGIPAAGKFTSIYMIPAGAHGIYTVTVSDTKILDSITFEVQ